MSAGLRIERIDRERARRHREQWNGLVRAMARPSVFCTWEWIDAWWRHFGQAYEPVVLFAYRDAELVGILPLALARMVVEDAVVPGRALVYCGSRELCSDHLDVIAAPGDAHSCLDAAWRYLQNNTIAWDVAHLSHLPEDGVLTAWAAANGTAAGEASQVSSAAYIQLPRDFAEYEKRLPGDKRRDLKRQRRGLYEKHGVRYEAHDGIRHPEGVRELFRLHALRAARRGARTAFHGEALMRFHEDIAATFDALGWLRLRFLRAGDRTVAANYCFAYANRFFGYQQGLDPDWERFSVGNVLMYELIREACETGIAEFDLLRGGGKHKELWTDRRRALLNVNLYNSTAAGRAIRWTSRARRAIASRVKRLDAVRGLK